MKILAEAEPAFAVDAGGCGRCGFLSEAVRVKVEVFFAERLEFYLREGKGQAYDVVKAVLAAGANDVRDAVARAEAVTAVRGSEDFAAVSAAFKRMKNILAQAAEKGDLPQEGAEDLSGAHPTETILSEQATQIGQDVKELERNYVSALETIATLRPYVDAFFDQVMIMDAGYAGAAPEAADAAADSADVFRDCGLFGDCDAGVRKRITEITEKKREHTERAVPQPNRGASMMCCSMVLCSRTDLSGLDCL